MGAKLTVELGFGQSDEVRDNGSQIGSVKPICD
jgi:hypothetical protein